MSSFTNDLSNEERETHLSMVASDRSEWIVFTDDPVWIARLDKILTAYKVTETGKHYRLPDNQLTIRKPRKPMSDKRKAEVVKRLAKAREIAAAQK